MLFLFIVALVLYTWLIWTRHFFHWEMGPLFLVLFGLAVGVDLGATLSVATIHRDAISWTSPHVVSGIMSLIVMAVHFVWACLAYHRPVSFGVVFDRWSPWAWALWLVSFLTGLI